MATVTGDELVVRALRAQGVTQVFSLPGVGIFPIYQACVAHGLNLIGGRHEEGVVHAAEGWAKVARQTGVALVAEGPGHANALPGVAGTVNRCPMSLRTRQRCCSAPGLVCSATDPSPTGSRGTAPGRAALPRAPACRLSSVTATLIHANRFSNPLVTFAQLR